MKTRLISTLELMGGSNMTAHIGPGKTSEGDGERNCSSAGILLDGIDNGCAKIVLVSMYKRKLQRLGFNGQGLELVLWHRIRPTKAFSLLGPWRSCLSRIRLRNETGQGQRQRRRDRKASGSEQIRSSTRPYDAVVRQVTSMHADNPPDPLLGVLEVHGFVDAACAACSGVLRVELWRGRNPKPALQRR
ncbi:hypothetical protein NM208_g15107 [Fusarium decemcellulare]|uniref:Uncharacterized protein n=1 Tax=Fusarium decemcellulare TaxID=57161 RepID=A0ACC1RFV1_9HYPO|nr:hypothetical protein NM208_g15107 [Fusarium decemcellulare]